VTLVGPRAEVPDIVARYTSAQRGVLTVKPGITGPGQLYYTTDQADSIPDDVVADDYYVAHLLAPKLDIDLDYVRRRTAMSDLRVLLDTAGLLGRTAFRMARAPSRGD
jgi:lipopolysaccharide/colanic/teichoic acid biosynthesis glycosyltransferase